MKRLIAAAAIVGALLGVSAACTPHHHCPIDSSVYYTNGC